MRYFVTFCVGLIVASLAVCTWTDGQIKEQERIAKAASAASAIKQAAYAESLTFVRRDTIRVTRWATRYDTIRAFITDSVIADTVATVPAYWVKTLIVAADSTVAACRDLVGSTRGALTACDSAQAALRLESDAWKKAFQAAKPSRFQRALPWIAGAAGFWAGSKLRVP